MIADKVEHLTATDLAPDMIGRAEGKLSQFSNVEVQIEDCYNTSFQEDMFDAVLLVNLLHIVKDPVTVLRESRRVLKDDGRVVIADVTGYGMPFLSKMGLGLRYLRRWGMPTPYNRNLSPVKLAVLVKEAGFVVAEAKLIGRDTKAVCLIGQKVGREGIRGEK